MKRLWHLDQGAVANGSIMPHRQTTQSGHMKRRMWPYCNKGAAAFFDDNFVEHAALKRKKPK